jgi:hypothetical protein
VSSLARLIATATVVVLATALAATASPMVGFTALLIAALVGLVLVSGFGDGPGVQPIPVRVRDRHHR